MPCAYRADLIIDDRVLVEVKSLDTVLPVHHTQMLTYLRLSGVHQGLLINFNVRLLTEGLKSFLRGNVPERPDVDPLGCR
jgi:GxxExxY protein